jgi:hypothetical protein
VDSLNLSSNYNYKFALNLSPNICFFDQEGRKSYSFFCCTRYRFNDKCLLVYSFNFSRQNNNKIYNDDIDVTTILVHLILLFFANEMLLPIQILFRESILSTVK